MANKFTKEMIDNLADKLLIGLTPNENKEVLEQFEQIDETINIINDIEGIESVEPQSWCLDRVIDDLREDEACESLSREVLFSNSDKHNVVEIEVPKVVGNSQVSNKSIKDLLGCDEVETPVFCSSNTTLDHSSYLCKDISSLHDDLLNKKVSSDELVNESIKLAHEAKNNYNAFVTIIDDAKGVEVSDDLLSGIPFGIKDNYSTKGILSTGSSNTLKDYVPFFDATCVANLYKHGAVAVGKTVLDEFGMGGTGTTGHTGNVLNPWDKTRMCAGSSSGSAASVAAGVYPYALGSDTGDSIRKPAAYCGIVGYKPTYGMISRFGLFPFASSLDTCGVLTRNVKDAAIVVDAMKGIDYKDMTSFDSNDIHLLNSLNGNIKEKKLCYVKELCDINNYDNPSEELRKHLELFKDNIEKIKGQGILVDEVHVDQKLLNAVNSVYVVISCAEATSNMSNLTGISFGPRFDSDNFIDMMKGYRTLNFSSLIKKRFVVGSYVLQEENKNRYFFNAQRVRRMLVDIWNKLFEEYDAVILPVGCGIAKKFDDVKSSDIKVNALDEHLQIGNFGGFPSISIPDGFIDNMPVGLNITGKCYDDENVLNIAYGIENILGYKNLIAKEGNDE